MLYVHVIVHTTGHQFQDKDYFKDIVMDRSNKNSVIFKEQIAFCVDVIFSRLPFQGASPEFLIGLAASNFVEHPFHLHKKYQI